ncbi:hypothetical protein DRH27_04435 [Candidatus Falkowbacteria bacterium]|nr:MAG: hypothetical protein DRH27_04435 [Candidatus Falkowbacteria bacterium]
MKKTTRVKQKITVKLAKEFLDSRKENQRSISKRHVSELTDAMLMNRWQYNGESIKFNVDGQMIDGQHRCCAAIKAGKSFISDIVYGLPKEAYYTIDQKSRGRSPGDVLRINGELNAQKLSIALSYNIAYDKGYISRSGRGMPISPDAQQICVELDNNPMMRESVKVGSRCSAIMGSSPLSFLHYRFSQKDIALADKFFVQLATGENLSKTNPVLYIRKALLEDKIHNKAKLPMGEKIAYVIKGWNLLRHKKIANSVKSISWRSTGKSSEAFPVIK